MNVVFIIGLRGSHCLPHSCETKKISFQFTKYQDLKVRGKTNVSVLNIFSSFWICYITVKQARVNLPFEAITNEQLDNALLKLGVLITLSSLSQHDGIINNSSHCRRTSL